MDSPVLSTGMSVQVLAGSCLNIQHQVLFAHFVFHNRIRKLPCVHRCGDTYEERCGGTARCARCRYDGQVYVQIDAFA